MAGTVPIQLVPSGSPEERRRATRKQVSWPAKLEVSGGWVECQVIDLSPTGAKARIKGPLTGTNQVRLAIDHLGNFDGTVVWQTKSYIGIQFTRLPASEAPAGGALSRVQMISLRARARGSDSIEPGMGAEPIRAVELPAAALSARMAPEAPPRQARTPQPMPTRTQTTQSPIVTAAVAVILPEIINQINSEAITALSREELVEELGKLVHDIAVQNRISLSAPEQMAVTQLVINDMLGLGPLEPLLADPTVTDILVNGSNQVYVERRGKLELTNVKFTNDRHVFNIATRIVSRVGRRVDESMPLADARLEDGSRVNIILPPLSLRGPIISIRKFPTNEITLDRMVKAQNISAAMGVLLKVAAQSRLNILISGGTGSGKTTLLNAISQMIDPGDRVVTIEDAAELQLQLPHVVNLETRPPNLEDEGEITMRDLFRNALRMRPDRIILGEIRSAEAFDVLQAMNTGHDGSLATIHASTARAALTRLESILMMTTAGIPAAALRRQIASAVDLVVQVSRMRDGKRRVISIAEIVGSEGEVITMHDLFTFEAQPHVNGTEVVGRFVSTGVRPHFLAKAEAHGLAELLQKATSAPESCTVADLIG
ncbi:MAG TPA: ATPase, T2SS/T4P/T4SS family [Aliidongia sp.]|nr:ATPase, T2SS/T4P/T4SS family [Aliidongia sp.]